MEQTNVTRYFIELLQITIGTRQQLTDSPTPEEWEEIYSITNKQSVVGICFTALPKLPKEQRPTPRRIRQWSVRASKIRDKNISITKETKAVQNFLQQKGFKNLILKGQSNMAYYPAELQDLRMPGDIDVWVMARPSQKEAKHDGRPTIRQVIEFCQNTKRGNYVYYHNLDFPILKETPVEVHYRPTWLFCPWRDKPLQRWFTEHEQSTDFNDIKMPTTEFNILFQLLHMYKHIFESGIGLRQLLDYFYVLQAYASEGSNNAESIRTTLQQLNLTRFTGSVMWIMQKVFLMDDRYLICTPNERYGSKLFEEVMLSGNFGQHDERYNWEELTNSKTLDTNGTGYAIARLRHNMTFLGSYAEETIFEPLFRIYHWLWRRFHIWT